MSSRLPATPLEALSISGALRMIVKLVHTWADLFGFWKHPSKKAAADFEDMSLMDKMYWGYKSKKPVRLGEQGQQLETFKSNLPASFTLPKDFETKNTVTFGAAGDLIKVEGLEHSGDLLYEDVADVLMEKDISYGNLESQMTGQDLGDYTFSEKETPPLCCTPEQYNALKKHKDHQLTLLHTACNHTLDMGLEGVETTLEMLRKDGIIDLGTNREKEMQYKGRVVEKNGIRIGFVSATLGLNGKEIPEGKEYIVNVVKFHPKGSNSGVADLSLLERQIDDCNARNCDIIVASLHWGYEYEFIPRNQQVELAHRLVESGVDVIIGHHSHVLQPLEIYRPRRNPDRAAVIAYSLGNLTSSFSAPHLVLSGILTLDLSKGIHDGQEKTLITGADLVPVVQEDFDENGLPKVRLLKLDTFLKQCKKAGDRERIEYAEAVKEYAALVIDGKFDKGSGQ